MQEAISYGLYLKSDYQEIEKSFYKSYTGNDAPQIFVKNLISQFNRMTYKVNEIMKENKKVKLTKEQKRDFDYAKVCYMCEKVFTEDNKKVCEHNHFNGKYRGAACHSCNIKEGKNIRKIPIFFHNGSNYDFHFLIKELIKYEGNGKKVNVLAKTGEEYISITYESYGYKLVFLDSYRFLSNSLEKIIEGIPKEELKITKEHFKDEKQFELISQKGVYPYEYIDSIEKLKDSTLPEYEHFYSRLQNSNVTKEEYERSKKVWKEFNCNTFQDYHDLYLKADVLLLADAFEKFREFNLKYHQIDPCYTFSAPGLTWQAGLKYTKVKLELLTDYNMYLMFEAGIRGGYSGVLGDRYVKANNKYIPNYDPIEKQLYLLYLDCNNLYGDSMSQKLPIGDFKEETDENYYKNIPDGRGCIIECDLEYPDAAKLKTFKFPLAPEKKSITEDQLSSIQKKYMDIEERNLGKIPKLILDLHNKEKYIVHHKILKYYISLGLRVTKVHKTISFKEEAWLKPYIDFNTNQRKLAKTEFEKDFWKLMNNAFYGKTMENVRDRNLPPTFSSDEKELKNYSRNQILKVSQASMNMEWY